MNDRPKIGEQVFVQYNDTDTNVAKSVVTKVGRKYFEVKGEWDNFEFGIQTEWPDYWRASKRSRHKRICYRSPEAIQNAIAGKRAREAEVLERAGLEGALRNASDYSHIRSISLDQLRRIKAILDEGKEVQP